MTPPPSSVRTQRLVAYAHVADVDASIRFYADLGFEVANRVGEQGCPTNWAWLASGEANLMLARASGPVDAQQQAVLFYLYVDDIQDTRAALIARGHQPGAIPHPFYLPNGEFRFYDLDGYVLMIAQDAA